MPDPKSDCVICQSSSKDAYEYCHNTYSAHNPLGSSAGLWIRARWSRNLPALDVQRQTGVGTSLNPARRVWFTLSHGIFNELYFPRLDQACARDLGLIVTDGRDFFSEEKRDTKSELCWLAPGVPAFHITNTHRGGRYRIEKEILADPRHDAVLQRTRFVPLRGEDRDYHVYALLAPHLGNRGRDNNAWIGQYKGSPMLFAQRENLALALACSVPWARCSVGFVGRSDGWQDLKQHKQMTWFTSAPRAAI